MRIVGVAIACVLLGGCTIKTGYTSPDPNPPTVRRQPEPEPVVHTRREPRPRGPELVAANAPRAKSSVPSRSTQTEAMCAATRVKRDEDRAAWKAWLERKAAFEAWSAEHCVQIDHGQDELQTLMNHKGQISQRVVTIGDTETKCDTKAPDDLKSIRGSKPEYDVSADYRCGDTLSQQAERASVD